MLVGNKLVNTNNQKLNIVHDDHSYLPKNVHVDGWTFFYGTQNSLMDNLSVYDKG